MITVKFYDCRSKREWWVNPEFVQSFYAEKWPSTPAITCIEVKGNQGYGNHYVYVSQTCTEVAALLCQGLNPPC